MVLPYRSPDDDTVISTTTSSDDYACSTPSSSRDSQEDTTDEITVTRRRRVSTERTSDSARTMPVFWKGVLLLTLTVTVVSQHVPMPIMNRPLKLLQGCPTQLLHTRSYGHARLLCRDHPGVAIAAYEGIREAMNQCKERMQFHPWDCTPTPDILQDPAILRNGYRESALVWALSSAGAAWGVTTACSQGWLSECSCAHPNSSQWEWGGCSTGLHYGITASRRMLTRTGGILGQRPALRRAEKHNLKAGRLAVKKTLTSQCKCHGVSGSCQQKTCWKVAANVNTITRHIIDKYHKARMVADDGRPRNNDLIFFENSPDACALRGNQPRVCGWRNETHAQGDCGRLCCGRGFNITHEVTPYKCDCKVVWCCNIVCNDCLMHRWISTCS